MLSTLSRRGYMLLAAMVLVLVVRVAAFPQAPPPVPPESAAPAPPPPVAARNDVSAADVAAFLDGLVPAQLQRENIAGAVVIVVKDGQVLFASGYGYADMEKRTPVTPDTLFRPGSVGKLFTWTGIMQLVEQGKLDLDRDVNEYLDFTIPPAFGKPITLRSLLTHTPGFEETLQQLFVGDLRDMAPLGAYLKAHLPNRMYPPGTTPAYSNYGATLAGYILQRVSGEPFDAYMDAHILQPLGMDHSTFRQPLPASLEARMSKGYLVASDPPRPFEYVVVGPAGSASMPASDMARFMIAHLQDGQYQGVRILRPETARMMHSRQFASMPSMNGMALGFYEETRNGPRVIGHSGDTPCFHSDLHLVPEAGVGFFVSYNSRGKGEVNPRPMLWQAFLDRYFPAAPATPAVVKAPGEVDDVPGTYLVSRRADTTFMRLIGVLGQTTVSRNQDGTISADLIKAFNGQPKRFARIGPDLFQEVNGQDRLGFKHDTVTGRTTMVVAIPAMVFQKARWYENAPASRILILASVVVLVLALLFWPIGAAIRWHYGRTLEVSAAHRRLRTLVRLVALCVLVWLVSLLVFFVMASMNSGLLQARYNGWLRAIQAFAWLGVAGTVGVLYYLARTWFEGRAWVWTKLAYSVSALACVAFVWFVFNWNALVWNLNY